MADKKYFTLNQTKKTITVDTTITPAAGDEEAVALYVKMGYALVIKSQKRAKQMRDKADKRSKEDFEELLKDNPEGLKTFKDICDGKQTNDKGCSGLWAAKRWYRINIEKKPTKAEEEEAKAKGKKK